jgi:hypothetical protein
MPWRCWINWACWGNAVTVHAYLQVITFCQVYRINSSSVCFDWGCVRRVSLFLRQVCISLHPYLIRLPQAAWLLVPSVSASITCRPSFRAGLYYLAQSSDHKYLFVSVTCSLPISASWCPVIRNPQIASLQSSIFSFFSFVCCCTGSLGADSRIKFFGWTDVFQTRLRLYSGIKTVMTKTGSDSETPVVLNHVTWVPVPS